MEEFGWGIVIRKWGGGCVDRCQEEHYLSESTNFFPRRRARFLRVLLLSVSSYTPQKVANFALGIPVFWVLASTLLRLSSLAVMCKAPYQRVAKRPMTLSSCQPIG